MLKQINLWFGILLTWIILGLYCGFLIFFVPKFWQFYNISGMSFSLPAAFMIAYAKQIILIMFLFNIYLVFQNKKSPVLLRVGLFGELLMFSGFLFSLWKPFL